MATLQTAFSVVRQGGPAALLIGGEAGVGKARLISEFAFEAQAVGARVLRRGAGARGRARLGCGGGVAHRYVSS
jgi:hypothetical protein